MQRLSQALRRSTNRRLWQELRPFGGSNELIYAALRNDLFLLYFAIGQDQDPAYFKNCYEDLRHELRKLGVCDMPPVPLRKLRSGWFETQGDEGVNAAMDVLTEAVQSAVGVYAEKYAAESSKAGYSVL
jgi:hypothetical protein